MRTFAQCFIALLASILLASCGGGDSSIPDAAATTPQQTTGTSGTQTAGNIVVVAQQQGFNALLAAATKANLGSALTDAKSSLTVFAPTDAAFNQLAGALGFANAEAMVNALPADTLQSLLLYHVLPAAKAASVLVAEGSRQETLYRNAGRATSLALDTSQGVRITDAALTTANVVAANVAASNGVIHAVDKVLVPPGLLNIVQMAQVNPDLSSLVAAVKSANLQGALSGAGPLTVFAPTNAAFAKAPSGLDAVKLGTVLKYHVLASAVRKADIPFGTPVPTLAQQNIVFSNGTAVTIRDTTGTASTILAADVEASNGIIHVIDKVLIPAL
ncbi:fasciclin domain-containing protein [Noviherbaspirillum galbum]|uniref:Fasciclin domain-containing protein n=1 Tax=Noviherbaspirillum galbum TaxID=2709383 RepID=A0A6B3SJS9_9BURK|nr:fasciclin domain-containing protein [Noviherbaspirillum galbum]NEX60980.1 fasciclin domain-containing protein [Noviherbaspirillum galbum]